MSNAFVPPSIELTAFHCPSCGVLAAQTWHEVDAYLIDRKDRVPTIASHEWIEQVAIDPKLDAEDRDKLIAKIGDLLSKVVSVKDRKDANYTRISVENVHVANCYNCDRCSLWVHDRLIHPALLAGDLPNPDMPSDIALDFREAQSIVNFSPRGSAALLRLCIQKLCIELGEKGKRIDDDIAALVKKGLNPIVQKSLDVVRVVGNDSVHPGSMDMKDDAATALKLFKLVNLIVEQMISLPKSINELYDGLPEAKRQAIDSRDGR